ncbi:hypothetical protein FA15DRAFT_709223 [Coprinopsis marcescibilis]|uniref:Uncharacterized protein n=1 Tax=Coprinopsis marcescibilis TaxID=230819 RepID=A0A5C3KGU0_COPMA|nr:hypothetical protein FA15DRAFT_709223 [Coprinopsis marcescibilis]
MPTIDLDTVGVVKLEGFREFFFTQCLANEPNNNNLGKHPYFDLKNLHDWVQESALQLYVKLAECGQPCIEEWSQNKLEELKLSGSHLKAFQRFLVMPKYETNKYFSLGNQKAWFKDQAHTVWYNHVLKEGSSRSPGASPYILWPPSLKDVSYKSKVVKILQVFIFYCTTISICLTIFCCSAFAENPLFPVVSKKHDEDTFVTEQVGNKIKIKITDSVFVDHIETITQALLTWTVPQDNTAYLLKLDDVVLPKKKGKTTAGMDLSIDAFIQSEDQDAWHGSTGRPVRGDSWTYNLGDDPYETVRCHVATLSCSGVSVCTHFDKAILEDCQHYDPDQEDTRLLWAKAMNANALQADCDLANVIRFYQIISSSTCPNSGCKEQPKLQVLPVASWDGKNFIVGCSHPEWSLAKRHLHRNISIPEAVNENVLLYVMAHAGHLPESALQGESCNLNHKCPIAVHPCSHKQYCSLSHMVNGVAIRSPMINHTCLSRMKIYVPPSNKEQELVTTAIMAVGTSGLTHQQLLSAPTTTALCGGQLLNTVAIPYLNNRCLYDAITEHKRKEFPKGLQWEGVQHNYLTLQSKLPVAQCYIHSMITQNGCQMVVTMNPDLAKHIHDATSLAIDFTYK